jgi:gluconate kinase
MNNKFKLLAYHLMQSSDIFYKMKCTIEGSMHHREANVLVHTYMVLNEYFDLTTHKWKLCDLEGAFACLFHDVGKPAAEVNKFSEERGHYHSYPGHELISARIWENWAVEHYGILIYFFPCFNFQSIYNIGWMIEHHLPYDIKNKYKLECIYKTGKSIGENTFTNVLLADGRGRINDNAEAQGIRQQTWLNAYTNYEGSPDVIIGDRHVHMIIGPSGVGKSTITNKLVNDCTPDVIAVFSLDKLRLDWYSDLLIMNPNEQYDYVHEAALSDPKFNGRWQREYVNLVKSSVKMIIIDGTNLFTKHRRFFLDVARNNDIVTHAVYLTSSLKILEQRQNARTDKIVDMNIVKKQYANIQYPSYNEFDVIHII